MQDWVFVSSLLGATDHIQPKYISLLLLKFLKGKLTGRSLAESRVTISIAEDRCSSEPSTPLFDPCSLLKASA